MSITLRLRFSSYPRFLTTASDLPCHSFLAPPTHSKNHQIKDHSSPSTDRLPTFLTDSLKKTNQRLKIASNSTHFQITVNLEPIHSLALQVKSFNSTNQQNPVLLGHFISLILPHLFQDIKTKKFFMLYNNTNWFKVFLC